MIRHIVEGKSPDSMEEAVAQAMLKAAAFVAEVHDIRVAVLELSAVRHGGYKAVLEVAILPAGGTEKPLKKASDIELKQDRAIVAGTKKEQEAARAKARIVDHFRRRRGQFLETAAMHLSYLTEGQLLGHLDGEYRAATPGYNPGLVLPDPAAIRARSPGHERVSDKIHRTPLDEIVEREFDQAAHADKATLKSTPAQKSPGRYKKPDPAPTEEPD